MVERKKAAENATVSPLNKNLERVDEDLDIMEKHAGTLEQVEGDIQGAMRKWDREYKDERLHSIPKSRKHVR